MRRSEMKGIDEGQKGDWTDGWIEWTAEEARELKKLDINIDYIYIHDLYLADLHDDADDD